MPADRPVISVLLLCHNEAVFVRRAVRSVLSQSFDRAVEIILMDDASVDDSAAIVQAEVTASGRSGYQLRVLRSDRNLGNGAAFVTALRAARGRFYHVMDGDDFWIDPDKLKTQVALLKAAPKLAGVAHRAIVRASEDGTESFHPRQEPAKALLAFEDLLTGGLYFHSSAMLFRNSFYNAATDSSDPPQIFNDVSGDTIRLYVHAFQGGLQYLPQTMSVHDDHRAGVWTGLDWPGKAALLNNLYTQLSQHGYLDDMGGAQASAFLAERLAAIAAVAPSLLRPISLYPDQVATAPRKRLTGVSRISSVLDLETQVTRLTADKQYEDALQLIFRFLSALAYDPNVARASRARRLSSAEIDWHCAHIGGLIAADTNILPAPADPAPQGPVALVVSGMTHDSEGMWDQTRDMIALWRGRRRIVVLSTELLPTAEDIRTRVGPDVELLLNTDQSFAEKTAWLIWHIARLQPSQILVNPARNDVVIAAGVRREHAPRIHLIGNHTTGYVPGLHSYALDGYVARRPYDVAWFHRMAPGREVIHLPRFAHAPPARAELAADAPLVTATASLAEADLAGSYDYGLHLIVPSVLRGGAQRHVHVGPLSDAMLNRIRKELIRQGYTLTAFVHLPGTADIAADLVAAGASLFLQGFPLAAPAPLIAAMAAGLPVLAHRNYLHPALSLIDLCPPGTPEWADAPELEAILRNIGPGWLQVHSAATVQHMTHRLSGAELSAALAEAFMAPLGPEAIPQMHVPEGPQELRRLMSELADMTVFQL